MRRPPPPNRTWLHAACAGAIAICATFPAQATGKGPVDGDGGGGSGGDDGGGGIGGGSGIGATDRAASEAEAAASEPTISWAADRTAMNLGVDVQAKLTLTIGGPNASTSVPGRLRVSVGTISALTPSSTDPGTYFAFYRPPIEMRPQAAILAVEVLSAGGHRAYAVTHLRLDAPTRFPLRTSPAARVTINVKGRMFGPESADDTGQVFVPILVPPGVATGTARAVNQFGVAKETSVDLQISDFPRIVVFTDPEAEAGTEVIADVWAIDPSGEPASPEDMDLGASSGQIRRVGGARGHARFAVALPNRVGSGKVALIASMNDGSSTDVANVVLHPGPPAALALVAEPNPLRVGSGTHAAVTIFVHDRFGNRREPRALQVRVNDVPFPVQLAPDVAVVYVSAPATWPRPDPRGNFPDRLVIRADLHPLTATTELHLSGGAPVSATLTTDRATLPATGARAAEMRLRLRDADGNPAAATHVNWRVSAPGVLSFVPSKGIGDYVARFVPRRTLRDSQATVIATVDHQLSSVVRISMPGAAARTLTARVGVVTNLRTAIGPSFFVDALWPWWTRPDSLGRPPRMRLLAAGLSIGYLRSELTTEDAPNVLGVQVQLNQFPILAIARLRLPFSTEAEFFLSGMAGMTWARTSISANHGMGTVISDASAHGATVGFGAEASLPLDPGQLVLGARYLSATLGQTSHGDTLRGNSIGLVCDLGFKLGF